jgi:hypothetical protein
MLALVIADGRAGDHHCGQHLRSRRSVSTTACRIDPRTLDAGAPFVVVTVLRPRSRDSTARCCAPGRASVRAR